MTGRRRKEKEKGAEGAAAREQVTKVVLTCGMAGHLQFEPGKEPADGKCPVCEMKLVEKKVTAKKNQ